MMVSHSKAEIFAELKQMLQELFEIKPEQIILTARLYEDLDLDSIDAIDLLVQLQTFTGRKFQPAEFKAVRTIGDVVDVIYSNLTKT